MCVTCLYTPLVVGAITDFRNNSDILCKIQYTLELIIDEATQHKL